MNEPILQIVCNVYVKRNFFTRDAYRLVFTEEKILFSRITKELIKQEQRKLDEDLKGKSFKERAGAVFQSNQRVYDKYEVLSEKEILALSEGSFGLPYENILSIKKRVFFVFNAKGKPTRATLTTNSQKMKLSFSDEEASSKTYKIIKDKIK